MIKELRRIVDSMRLVSVPLRGNVNNDSKWFNGGKGTWQQFPSPYGEM